MALSLGLTACGGSEASGTAAEGKQLVVQVGPDPETLDPALNSTIDGGEMLIHSFETLLTLDENNEVIGYKFVRLGKMLEDIRRGMSPNEAYEKNIGQYGRYDGAAKYIDPRED